VKFYENGDALTEPMGFFCSGVHCDVKGVRNGKLDLGIIYSQKSCNGAGVFTTNDVQAAPVRYSKNLISESDNTFHAIVANSGNANACTGEQGEADAKKNGFGSREAFKYSFQGSTSLFNGKDWGIPSNESTNHWNP